MCAQVITQSITSCQGMCRGCYTGLCVDTDCVCGLCHLLLNPVQVLDVLTNPPNMGSGKSSHSPHKEEEKKSFRAGSYCKSTPLTKVTGG